MPAAGSPAARPKAYPKRGRIGKREAIRRYGSTSVVVGSARVVVGSAGSVGVGAGSVVVGAGSVVVEAGSVGSIVVTKGTVVVVIVVTVVDVAVVSSVHQTSNRHRRCDCHRRTAYRFDYTLAVAFRCRKAARCAVSAIDLRQPISFGVSAWDVAGMKATAAMARNNAASVRD